MSSINTQQALKALQREQAKLVELEATTKQLAHHLRALGGDAPRESTSLLAQLCDSLEALKQQRKSVFEAAETLAQLTAPKN
jgi:hypothetical protein